MCNLYAYKNEDMTMNSVITVLKRLSLSYRVFPSNFCISNVNKQCIFSKNFSSTNRISAEENLSSSNFVNTEETQDIDIIRLNSEISNLKSSENDYLLLQPPKDDLSNITPYMQPTYNIAAYIDRSPSLQELVKLGVNFHDLERKKGAAEFILSLDFNEKMKNHIRFLHNVGVNADDLGNFITKNPFIFKEDLDDLQIRINYLESKRFKREVIASIISREPQWLSFRTQDIDQRLGYFQKTFRLTGEQVRQFTTKRPRTVTYKLHKLKVNIFMVKEEMGFTEIEMRNILLENPKIYTLSKDSLWPRFDYVHNTMKISHEQIAQSPIYLTSRVFRIRQRHMFLQSLYRAQYNPKLENYVSPEMLVAGSDVEFCDKVAKTSVESFNMFLKTL